MFIWDIQNQKYIKKGYPFTNLKSILKKENNIKILYNDILIDFEYKVVNKKELRSYIILESKDSGYTGLKNLSIKIYKNSYNSELSNLSKSDNLTGKQFEKLCQIISKKINCNKIYLLDEASIICKPNNKEWTITDFSLYLLFKTNKTYYQKLGYNIDIKYDGPNIYFRLNKTPEETIMYVLNKINKLKISDIIENNKIILNEFKHCIIHNTNLKINRMGQPFIENNGHSLYDYYNKFIIYSNYFLLLDSNKNLIKSLLKIYDQNCILYNNIINIIIDDSLGDEYIFNKKIYKCEYIYLFNVLYFIKRNMQWMGYYYKNI